MKYLIINSTRKHESTGQITDDMYKFIKLRGDSVLYCFGRDDDKTSDPNIIRIDTNLEIYSHVILARITGLQGYFSNRATSKLIKIIDNFKPDAVIIGSQHGYYLNYKRLLQKLKNEKIVTYCYLFDEYPFLGKCAFAYDCEKYKVQCKECPYVHDFPKSILFDQSTKIFNDKMKLYTGFTTLKFMGIPYTVHRAKESALIATTGVGLYDFGWGIDTKSVYFPHDASELRKKHHIPDENIVILAVASYTNRRKGIRDFYYTIAERLRDKPFTFIHIGFNGKKEDVPQNKSVITMPYLSDQELLAQYYSLADLFVIPSLNEGQPTVSLISLCCGTPVLGFNISGVPYAAPPPYGTYVEPENIDELLKCIKNTKKKTNEVIIACREYAEMNIDKDAINERIVQQIEKDINNRN